MANAKATGCFTNTIYKYLNGSDWNNITTNVGYSTILAQDGMSYAFYIISTNCTTDLSSPSSLSSPLYNTCGTINVDINGPNKGPAMHGRDLFGFWVTKKGIYPSGAYPDAYDSDCSTNGAGCTSKVLLEGAMNY